MKRKVVLGALLALSLVSVGYACKIVTTCGKIVTTVGEDYFETREEFLDFIQETNELRCGKKSEREFFKYANENPAQDIYVLY
ncbi:MAG: hypothetical protein Q3998_04805 [Porphyromonas sp.]|nr:hypothetical protein [Porphyromonas sp.]